MIALENIILEHFVRPRDRQSLESFFIYLGQLSPDDYDHFNLQEVYDYRRLDAIRWEPAYTMFIVFTSTGYYQF